MPEPPPPSPTLKQVRDQIRQRADMVHSSFVTDEELNAWIRASTHELIGLIVSAYGESYFLEGMEGETNEEGRFELPPHFKIAGVDLRVGGRWVTLQRAPFAERNRQRYGHPRYIVTGPMLSFVPELTPGRQIKLYYVPVMGTPTEDDDEFNTPNGWEEYVIVDCVIKCLQKEESDVSVPMAQKAALIRRLENEAANRDIGMPLRVADVRGGHSSITGMDPYSDWEP